MKKKKPGRPPTRLGAYDKPRQIGRVSDEDWELLKAAAEKKGVPFTQWALEILIRNAKSQLKK